MKKYKKIYIEITNLCNKNCSFCEKDNRIKKELSIEEFELILKKIDNLTNYVCLHVKGEPLIHSNIKGIVDLCEKYNKKIILTTNGSLIEKNISLLTESKIIKQLNISLNSIEKIENIDEVEKIINLVDSIKVNKNISIIYRFWAQKEKFLNSVDEYKVNLITKKYNIKYELFENNSSLRLDENVYFQKANLFYWPDLSNNYFNDDGFCYALKTHFAILSDGTVIPCCLDCKGIIKLGNIFDDNLEAILKSELSLAIKNSFKEKKAYHNLCKHCSFKSKFETNMI